MQRCTAGINHLVENDILNIFREHFARYGFGFKRVTFAIDYAERDKPRFEIDIKLDPLNKKKVDKFYSELMEVCLESSTPQKKIMEKIYEAVKTGGLSIEDFSSIIDKVKGQSTTHR